MSIGAPTSGNVDIPALLLEAELAGNSLNTELKHKLDALIPHQTVLCSGCGSHTSVEQISRSFGSTSRIIADLHCRNCANLNSGNINYINYMRIIFMQFQ